MKKIFSLLAIAGFLASMFAFAPFSNAQANRGDWGWNRYRGGFRHIRFIRGCGWNRCWDRCDFNRCGNWNWGCGGGCGNWF